MVHGWNVSAVNDRQCRGDDGEDLRRTVEELAGRRGRWAVRHKGDKSWTRCASDRADAHALPYPRAGCGGGQIAGWMRLQPWSKYINAKPSHIFSLCAAVGENVWWVAEAVIKKEDGEFARIRTRESGERVSFPRRGPVVGRSALCA